MERSGHRYDLSGLSILVVDDCDFMRTVLQRLLEAFGVGEIRYAGDGTAAWAALSERPADVVLTDWAMHPMDGASFMERLRCAPDSPCRYVPVIMLTGYTERDRVERARDLGVTEFLAKPVAARALHARLIQAIFRPRPFVRTADYFGPCRRRLVHPGYRGPERRRDSAAAATDA